MAAQQHCTVCGRTMSRRDREQGDGLKCYYCLRGLARPPAGDLPAAEVERRMQTMLDRELLMPWERPAKKPKIP